MVRCGGTSHNGGVMLVDAVLVLGVIALLFYGVSRLVTRDQPRRCPASAPASGAPPTTTPRARPVSCCRRRPPQGRTCSTSTWWRPSRSTTPTTTACSCRRWRPPGSGGRCSRPRRSDPRRPQVRWEDAGRHTNWWPRAHDSYDVPNWLPLTHVRGSPEGRGTGRCWQRHQRLHAGQGSAGAPGWPGSVPPAPADRLLDRATASAGAAQRPDPSPPSTESVRDRHRQSPRHSPCQMNRAAFEPPLSIPAQGSQQTHRSRRRGGTSSAELRRR